MYFTHAAGEPVEIPGFESVCLHCGSGHPISELGRVRRVCYRCPACRRLNPYFPPRRTKIR
jgi:hypothetical protein